MCDKVEDMDRTLAASRNRQHQDREHDIPGDGGDKASKPKLSIRAYWLLKNKSSLDGLPGLLTAPDAILSMTPQSNFDKDAPRPMLRRSTEFANTARDCKWFASGFALGVVIVFALTRLVGV
jgi:hypothetical protein